MWHRQQKKEEGTFPVHVAVYCISQSHLYGYLLISCPLLQSVYMTVTSSSFLVNDDLGFDKVTKM